MRAGPEKAIRLFLLLIGAALLASIVSAAEIPDSLRDIVFGAGHRPIVEIRLDGEAFDGLAPFSDVPYLLWPRREATLTHDRDRAVEWVRRCSSVLGHRDFEPRFARASRWRGNEVWIFELVRHGIALHDARVELHWRDRRLVGLVNHVPLPIAAIEPISGETGTEERVYTAVRDESGYALRLGRIQLETTNDRINTSIMVGSERVRRIVQPLETNLATTATFQEWPVPSGTFPDQIDLDSTGLVWFSQPQNDWVTSFDPSTEIFTEHDTTGGSGPDGMMVDGNDTLWTGMYFANSGLGKFDIGSSTFTTYAAPYPTVNMAIPVETTGGTIWVTDHERNRISEFDPGTETWINNLVMPTSDCWVTAGVEDPVSLDVYFTEYSADQLGRKGLSGPIVDIAVPSGSGPAFLAHLDGTIYFSEWNQDRLGAYEISSGIITEYVFPVAGEQGGPMDVTPGGLIAVGTRNQGYIMIFDPVTATFDAHPIPTANSGLKDGLRSDADGAIWFTETGADKLAVLRLEALSPAADFSGTPTAGVVPLSVDFTDLSSNSPTVWRWVFGDATHSSDPNPTHVFVDPGLYTVSLTARNDFGSDTREKVDYINVITACPLAVTDVTIFGERDGLDVEFSWGADPDCDWDVHRAIDPSGILATPPVARLPVPGYRDVAPPEPLIFYSIAPTDRTP